MQGGARSGASRWFVVFVAVLGIGASVSACGTGRPDATNGAGNAYGGGDGSVRVGPCATEGATSACHVETGRAGNIVNCFSGVQTCTNGTWSVCGGDGGGTVSTKNLDNLSLAAADDEGSGDLHPAAITVSGPTVTAALCASNPCNPYCLGIEVNADNLTISGGFTSSTILGTVKTPEDFPGGISGPKNAMKTFATSGPPAAIQCTQGHPPADGKICSSDYCCANYAVGGFANTCQPWATVGALNPIAVNNCVKATGVDFQLGLACNDTLGHVHVPVCNRGTAAATSGTVMIAEYPGNPKYAGDLSGPPGGYCNNPGDPSAYCLLNVGTKNIPAGKCIDVDLTAATAGGTGAGMTCPSSGFSSGNRTMMINPPEPPLPYASSFNPTTYVTVPEADPCNNYSFHPTTAQGGTCSQYGEQPPPPAAVGMDYSATCKPGEGVVWNQFTYSTLTPLDSEVIFKVSTAPRTAAGTPGTFTTPVQAADVKSDGSVDPQLCAANGATDPTKCPKNLATILGKPAQNYEYLHLDVTLIARTGIPIVYGWSASYSCVPRE